MQLGQTMAVKISKGGLVLPRAALHQEAPDPQPGKQSQSHTVLDFLANLQASTQDRQKGRLWEWGEEE